MELHQAPDQAYAVPVTRRSPEWGWLEYLLHASCAWPKKMRRIEDVKGKISDVIILDREKTLPSDLR